MEYRQLGNSGLRVSELCFGLGTFGGVGELFEGWGNTQLEEGKRLVGLCLDAGVNLFDTSDAYSNGVSEEIFGKIIQGKRNDLLISTKTSIPLGSGPNDGGSSRGRLLTACDNALRRLGTDHIDVYHMHIFDARTPIDETLYVLDMLVRSGKVRYIACSNFSGWHLMKSLATSERYGWPKYVSHQVYYSLIGRDYELELMPLAVDQKIGSMIWSPLGWGRLTGKVRRGQPLPKTSRLPTTAKYGPPVSDEYTYKVVDAIDEVAKQNGKTVAQIALNWLLRKPTVSSVIIGARNEEQLKQNLLAADFKLSEAQVKSLDAASAQTRPYPYWHQREFECSLPPVPEYVG